MVKLRSFPAAVFIAVLMSFGLSAPVNSAPSSTTDPTGDAASSINDITDLSLDFTSSAVTVEIELDAAPPAFSDSSWSHNEGDGRVFLVNLTVNGDQNVDGLRFLLVDGDGANIVDLDLDPICPVSRNLSSTTLTLSFSASCVGVPGDIAITVITGDLDVTGNNGLVPDDIAPANGSDEAIPLQKTAGGYWLLGGDGGVFSFAGAQYYGSTGDLNLNQPIVGMSAMPAHDGYRFVASDGGVFSYGSASFKGGMGGHRLNQPIVGMAPTPSGNGYWLVASDGGVFSFGDATFYGSMGGQPLNQPIVGMSATATGNGYYLVASDGGIFAFGDAVFHGSAGGMQLNAPIVGMAVVSDGYYLLARDGGVFSFGSAPFVGSGLGNDDLQGEVATMLPYNGGYYLVGTNGFVEKYGPGYNFADLVDYDVTLNSQIVGAAGFFN